MSKHNPLAWSLDGEAPVPMRWEDMKLPKDSSDNSGTHTGTDPYGRAVGPAEDHTKPKLDSEGNTAKEAAEKRVAKKAAAKKAAAKR